MHVTEDEVYKQLHEDAKEWYRMNGWGEESNNDFQPFFGDAFLTRRGLGDDFHHDHDDSDW